MSGLEGQQGGHKTAPNLALENCGSKLAGLWALRFGRPALELPLGRAVRMTLMQVHCVCFTARLTAGRSEDTGGFDCVVGVSTGAGAAGSPSGGWISAAASACLHRKILVAGWVFRTMSLRFRDLDEGEKERKRVRKSPKESWPIFHLRSNSSDAENRTERAGQHGAAERLMPSTISASRIRISVERRDGRTATWLSSYFCLESTTVAPQRASHTE